MGLTEEQIAQLKRDHGDHLIAVSKPMEMVFKKPPRQVWADFQDSISKGKGTREAAYRRLCLACAVHPAQSDVAGVFDDMPALPTKVGEELANLVGLGDDFEVKKL